MSFIVKGGEYSDVNKWDSLISGTEEEYGPFDTWEEATTAWKRGTFSQKLDIAGHRLFIHEI